MIAFFCVSWRAVIVVGVCVALARAFVRAFPSPVAFGVRAGSRVDRATEGRWFACARCVYMDCTAGDRVYPCGSVPGRVRVERANGWIDDPDGAKRKETERLTFLSRSRSR